MSHYLDYLRVSTWNQEEYLRELVGLRKAGTRWRKAKWLQYSGFKSDEYFYGIGEQQGRRHFILQASGPASAKLFELVKENDSFYCNRIDLQLTVKEPENYDPKELYDVTRKISGNRRGTSLILSDTGSTVYFGNRTSDSFARCYQKTIQGANFLRLELELKGVTARFTYENLRLGNLSAAEAYNHLFRRFKKPKMLDELFDIKNDKFAQFERFEHLKIRNDKLAWLMSLENAIIAMGNDHVTGQSVKTWLENILRKIDTNTT